ncbi:unnamed protein product, partial [Pneumocystis jirovecii]
MLIPQSKPENVLRRAEELIAVGQSAAALQSLHELILSKCSRNTSVSSLKPIMLRFVALCVDLRKGKMAKEALYQYKNIAQNTSVGTIEVVLKKFIDLVEEKVSEAQVHAEKLVLDAIDDLEASETPENIILSTVSGDQSKDRTDRAVVTPWLKFLWETYRTVLEILKNNARLEQAYQSTVNQAFDFCLKYSRKTEFRRLCDILRTHLQNATKYSGQQHSINFNDPETLQRHLDTRFSQLNAAVELELWQEAFRSVEDINNLLALSKRQPKLFVMANYYEKLGKIFAVSENYLFHAVIWNKYYGLISSQNKGADDKELERVASLVLLSALAIPVISTTRSKGSIMEIDDTKIRNTKLAALLSLSKLPTRNSLLKEALGKNILVYVRKEIKELCNILEVEFHPLSICQKVEPLIKIISQDPDMIQYIKPLQHVILTRLFQQLSQVYETIKLDFILSLLNFSEPFHIDSIYIEKFIMNASKKGELSIRIDHSSNSLIFETNIFASHHTIADSNVRLQSTPSELIRSQLSRIGKCLLTTVCIIDKSFLHELEDQKNIANEHTANGIEKEQKDTLARRAIIEHRKEVAENMMIYKEKEAATKRAQKLQQEQEAEQRRVAEEAKKREAERIKKETDAIRAEEARKAIQLEQLEKETRDLNEKLRVTSKRIDHLERAYRKEELPLLKQKAIEQFTSDKIFYEKARKLQLEASRVKHDHMVALKHRFQRLYPDYVIYRETFLEKCRKEFDQHCKIANEALEKAKEERRMAYRLKKEEEERQRLEEEERKRKKEEERERIRQEELRLKAIEEENRARKEEELRKLDQMAEKQKQKELEVERKLQRKKEELKSLDHSYDRWTKKDRLPPSDPSGEEKWRPGKGSWRLRVSERQELTDPHSSPNETKPDPQSKPTSTRPSTTDPPSTGIYKPPAARKENSR